MKEDRFGQARQTEDGKQIGEAIKELSRKKQVALETSHRSRAHRRMDQILDNRHETRSRSRNGSISVGIL